LILAILYSYVSQAKRPYQGPSRTPDEPEVTGVAVLLCHRLSEDRSRAEMTDDWAPARAKLVAGRWDDLGARRYAQVPRLNRWNVVFALLRVSRSWPVAVTGAILHGLPIPARARDASEQWDMIEVLEFADADSARCFLEGTTARSLAEDAAPWVQHAEAIPMITTRAYLGTHFAREATVTLFCLRARSEIGRTGMIDYWLDRHRPFVQGLRPLLNYAWYDQHIARGAEELEAPARAYLPGHAPWDGVASIGYAHLRDMASGLLDVRVQLANMRLVNDETRFLDLPRSALLVGTVTCVLGDDPD
ncbi:MAG: hypothetical protein AB8B85_15645, partial [Paracoccaceae bacterium]